MTANCDMPPGKPGSPLREDQREWLKKRIQQLRSRQQNSGYMRQAGIQRTIDGMKEQIKTGVWRPYEQ